MLYGDIAGRAWEDLKERGKRFTMTEEQEIEKLKMHNKLLKEKLKFLQKQNRELQHRLDAIALNAMAKEMTGCKNQSI